MEFERNTSGVCDWSKSEIEVSEILVEFTSLVADELERKNRVGIRWGRTRRRTALEKKANSMSNSKKVEAKSPDTPLCFCPDETAKFNKTSKAKLLESEEQLTQVQKKLKEDIEAIKRHRDNLIALNLKLKLRKQELCYGIKNEMQPQLVMKPDQQGLNFTISAPDSSQCYNQFQVQKGNFQDSCGQMTNFFGLGYGFLPNQMMPRGVLGPQQAFMFGSSQPLDMNKIIAAAVARHNRMEKRKQAKRRLFSDMRRQRV